MGLFFSLVMKTQNEIDEVVLNKREAAQFLKISPRTLDIWIMQRKISFIKYGLSKTSAIRFRKADLLDFLNQNTTSTVASN